MLDKITCIALNGVEIWKLVEREPLGNPINALIRNEVDIAKVQNRVREASIDAYRMYYFIDLHAEHLIVAVCSKHVQLIGIESLLKKVSQMVNVAYKKEHGSPGIPEPITSTAYLDAQVMAMRSALINEQIESHSLPKEKGVLDVKQISADPIVPPTPSPIEKLRASKASIGPSGRRAICKGKSGKSGSSDSKKEKPKGKKNRCWNDSIELPEEALDGSDPASIDSYKNLIQYDDEGTETSVELSNWDEYLQTSEEKTGEKSVTSQIFSTLRSRLGSRELTSADLEEALPLIREKLLTKNVVVPVADEIMESISFSLTGTTVGSYKNLTKLVEESLKANLRSILTPRKEVNLLKDVTFHKETTNRPFTICFCGVNGVGKSTSLSKIAYFLKKNGFRVLIAACDTFRGGAVEQLEVHSRVIGIPLYKEGYGLDAAKVASNSLLKAQKDNIDVVLVDTAGRMQGHDMRMKALSKLVYEIKPNLTLFVGEALAGNDGWEQLDKFNQYFLKSAPVGEEARGIDAVFLTKFDTIDDKVGAAVSMSYSTGIPVAFVGVGQTYQDIKKLDVDFVTKTLIS